MGRVSISEIHDEAYGLVQYELIYEYKYCDECGSFNIKRAPRVHETIQSALLILAFGSCFGAFILLDQFKLACPIALVSIVSFLLLEYFAGPETCMKCGNTYFSSENVLNYPNDKSVLDVPETQTLSRKITSKDL